MLRTLILLVLLGGVAAALPAQAQDRPTTLTAKQRDRERKAMSAYVASRYQEALDLYADLFADFHDPLYLRNIGRCHQKLKQPEQAISSFEEYLSRYKRLSAAEIDEVQGWIKEMKDLQKPPEPAPPPPVVVAAPPAPVVAAVPPPVIAPAPAPPMVAARALPPTAPEQNVTIRRVGVGALILGGALAVAGGVFEALSWSKFSSSNDNACLTTTEGCIKAADNIDRKAALSKIFFAGAAAAGLTGGALIIFFPVSQPGRSGSLSGLGAGTAWTF
jgi:tetratricopeptide (TPR) repeat protein